MTSKRYFMQVETKRKLEYQYSSDKIDFKINTIIRDKEKTQNNPDINQEDTAIINIYVPNIGAPRYVGQMLTNIKGKMAVIQ